MELLALRQSHFGDGLAVEELESHALLKVLEAF
jgi:hypothetical protein